MGLDFERRRLLAGVALTVGGHMLPMRSAAAPRGLGEYAAAQARSLAAGSVEPLRLLMPSGCEENLRPVIGAFHAATDVPVQTTEVPVDEINLQLSLDSMSGESRHDLALPATFGLPDLVSAGALAPLTDFARKHEPPGYRDELLYGVGDRFDDQLYGFQTDGDTYLMFYHRDLLEDPEEQARYADRFGRALAVPETWEELDRQMAWFHRPEQGLAGGLLFRTPDYLAWEWWVRFHARGVWPLSPDLVPQIAGDAGVAALEQMIRATRSLPAEVRTLGLFDNWHRYARGDVYCNIGWGGSQKYLNGPDSAMRGRMVYGPTPGGIVDGELLQVPYFNWGWNYAVIAASARRELAYLFALFASTAPISTASVREAGGYFDPFRAEHYDDPEIRRIYSDEFLQVHRDSLSGSMPDLYLANQGQYFGTLSEGLTRALSGKTPPRAALEKVARQWELISNRSDRPLQTRRWKELRRKYPAPLRSRLRDLATG